MKIGVIIFMITVLTYAVDVRTYIPKNAYIYYPTVIKASNEIFSEFILPPYFGALIEHESCVRLTWKSCWSPKSRLKTKREEGAGLGQLTKAYSRSGKLRFDKLRELRIKHPKHLKDLTWSNIYDRPDLQIKAVILLWKDDFNKLPDSIDYYNKIAMTDSAYNGGYGGVRKDRRYCGMIKDCDPNVWFDNVETHSLKSRRKLYGRSPYLINRHHVDDVLNTRLNKYIDLWSTYQF